MKDKKIKMGVVKELPYNSSNAKILAFLSYFAAFVVVVSFLGFVLIGNVYYFILTLIFVVVILVNLTQIRKVRFGRDGVYLEK